MGDRLGTFDSQTFLEQRHLSATDCSISTDGAELSAVIRLGCATSPTREQTSYWSSTAHAQISRYVAWMLVKCYTATIRNIASKVATDQTDLGILLFLKQWLWLCYNERCHHRLALLPCPASSMWILWHFLSHPANLSCYLTREQQRWKWKVPEQHFTWESSD